MITIPFAGLLFD
ncbi:putative phosphatase, partial [Vibrio harveyi]